MWKGGRVVGEHCRLHLINAEKYLGNAALHDEDWYRLELPPRETPLAEFDAVLMRKDPPFDLEYVTSTWLLEAAAHEGARVFNDPRAIRDHSEKLAIAQFPQFTAPTLVTRLMQQIRPSSMRMATWCSSRWPAWAENRCSASPTATRTAT
jgi:glutathione synthase